MCPLRLQLRTPETVQREAHCWRLSKVTGWNQHLCWGGFPSWAPATAPLGGSQGQSAHQAFLRLFLKRLFLASQSKGERGPLSVGGHGGLVGCAWQGCEWPLKRPQLRGHWQPISFRKYFTENFRRLEKNVETLDSFFAY